MTRGGDSMSVSRWAGFAGGALEWRLSVEFLEFKIGRTMSALSRSDPLRLPPFLPFLGGSVPSTISREEVDEVGDDRPKGLWKGSVRPEAFFIEVKGSGDFGGRDVWLEWSNVDEGVL
jgi:hypothetical protein